jgi:hypothetical protein
MELYLYFSAIILLVPYFLNPVLLRFKVRDYYEPCLEVVPEDELPQEVKDFLALTKENFQQAGFYHCTFAKNQNLNGSGEIFISLWFHREKGISAYSSICYTKYPSLPPQIFAKSVCFVTRFSQASQFESSISGVPSPLAKLPLRPCVQLPKRISFEEMLNAHQILAQKFHAGNERLLPELGQELVLMKCKIKEIHEYQIKAGRWCLDVAPNVYRLTWKGALINGWQFSWPVNSIRKWMLKRSAEKIFASVNH